MVYHKENKRVTGDSVMGVQKFCVLSLLVLLATVSVSSGVNPQVTLEITGGVTGTIVIEVYADVAPITSENFIQYVLDGFYNGLIFHRVVTVATAGVDVVQAGGFDADLLPRTTRPEIINESYNALSNIRGTLAMARVDPPHSASSQFFINYSDNTALDYGSPYYDQLVTHTVNTVSVCSGM
jgi:peptidyl-prolyl cis-trans isomerase B (cyclophilin B)